MRFYLNVVNLEVEANTPQEAGELMMNELMDKLVSQDTITTGPKTDFFITYNPTNTEGKYKEEDSKE